MHFIPFTVRHVDSTSSIPSCSTYHPNVVDGIYHDPLLVPSAYHYETTLLRCAVALNSVFRSY